MKYSDYLLYGVYGLIAINALSLIFTIILRIWRCNDSVLKNQSSSSKVISFIILILIIINFLCSIAEEVLYILSISFFFDYGDDEDEDDEEGDSRGSGDSGGSGGGGVCSVNRDGDDADDSEENSDKENEDKCRHLDGPDVDSTNINTIVVYNNAINSDIAISIINNTDAINNQGNNNINDDNTGDGNDKDGFEEDDDFEYPKKVKYILSILNKIDIELFYEIAESREKCKKLTFVPLITTNVNPFIQIISLIFIILIIKRINIKSHYGINPLNQSSIRNQIGSTKNVRDINDNQNENIFTGNIKKKKNNRLKKNKINKKKTTPSPKSEQLKIMENKRKKRKERNRKKNHKHKK